MTFQELLDSFTKKEFEVETRRTTKLAKWAFLRKGRKWSFGTDGIFLYFVDGDIKLEHMNDFVNRLNRIYDEHNFDAKDQAIFAYLGDMNSREFRTLARNSMDERVYKIIKIKKVKSSSKKTSSKTQVTKKREIKREQTKKKVEDSGVSVRSIINQINRWKKVAPRVTGKRKENQMTLSLVGFLASKFPDINQEHKLGRTRIDAVIGKTGIEAKYRPNQNEINRLFGQIDDYLRYLDTVIVVFYDSDQSMINNLERKLKTAEYNKNVRIVTV